MENKAAFITSPNSRLCVKDAPLTQPSTNEILIRNYAIAINPLDFKQQDVGVLIQSYPHIPGVDVSGLVVQVGSGVTTLKEGDRVAAIAPGPVTGNTSSSAFQMYTTLPEHLAVRIPDDLPFTSAAVLPLALATAASGLFEPMYLGISAPSASSPRQRMEKGVILVWGGSSSVGSCAVQLAVAAGFTVFATSSTKNFDYMRDLGAAMVFDYNDPDVVDQIVTAIGDKSMFEAYDAIASDTTALACANVLRNSGGKVYCTRPISKQLELPSGVTILHGPPPLRADDGGQTVWLRVWADFLGNGLPNGNLRAKPEPLVLEGGLNRLQEGVDIARNGVSARKVVVELSA